MGDLGVIEIVAPWFRSLLASEKFWLLRRCTEARSTTWSLAWRS